MTNKDFDRELTFGDRAIFQTHCAINMCRKMLGDRFGFTEDELKQQVMDSLGYMIDYTAYGIMSELELSDEIDNDNLHIIQDCMWNNWSLEDYQDRLVGFIPNDGDLRKEMKAMGFTESTIKYDDEK